MVDSGQVSSTLPILWCMSHTTSYFQYRAMSHTDKLHLLGMLTPPGIITARPAWCHRTPSMGGQQDVA